MIDKQTIGAQLLMQRLAMVLDDSCVRLYDVQDVVSHYVETGQLTSGQMERLQALDALTQEVEAVRSVLKHMGESTTQGGTIAYKREDVLADVHLSQVRDMLSHGKAFEKETNHGDVRLF